MVRTCVCAGTDTVPDSALDMAVQPRPRQPWQDARARMLHEHQGQDAAWEQDPMGFSPGCCTRSRQPGQLLMGNRSKALQSAAQTDMEAGKPPLESGQGAARGSQEDNLSNKIPSEASQGRGRILSKSGQDKKPARRQARSDGKSGRVVQEQASKESGQDLMGGRPSTECEQASLGKIP